MILIKSLELINPISKRETFSTSLARASSSKVSKTKKENAFCCSCTKSSFGIFCKNSNNPDSSNVVNSGLTSTSLLFNSVLILKRVLSVSSLAPEIALCNADLKASSAKLEVAT